MLIYLKTWPRFSLSIVFSVADQSISGDVKRLSCTLQLPALMSEENGHRASRYLQIFADICITITFASAPSHRRVLLHLLVFPSLLLSHPTSTFPSSAFLFFVSFYICFSTRTHTEPCGVDGRLLPTRPLSLAAEHAAAPLTHRRDSFCECFSCLCFDHFPSIFLAETLEGLKITRPVVNVLTNRSIMSVWGDEKAGRVGSFPAGGAVGHERESSSGQKMLSGVSSHEKLAFNVQTGSVT